MTSHVIDRIRIKPGNAPGGVGRAMRLERVARHHLGGALDRAFAQVSNADTDIRIERIVVRLPVEPNELDDDALATLWAALIRDVVCCNERRDCTSPPTETSATAEGSGATPSVSLDSVVVALLDWAQRGSVLPAAIVDAVRGSLDLCAEVLNRLPESIRPSALTILQEIRDNTSFSESPTIVYDTADEPHSPANVHHDGAGASSPIGDDVLNSDSMPSEPPAIGEKESRAIESTARRPMRVPDPGTPATPVTSIGGLVLLQHRLQEFLATIQTVEGNLSPVSARLVGLAALAEAGGKEGDALGDPLVHLLAGDPNWCTPEQRVCLPADPATATALATQLLHAFALDLPGFERSTPGFIFNEWIRRRAVILDGSSDRVAMKLSRKPLDLMLGLLPYSIASLRLPWAPTIVIGWEAQ